MAPKESQVIEKFSFLLEGKRQVVYASDKGTFRVPVTKVVAGRVKTNYQDLTAREVIEHPSISKSDPVATLVTGEKIRIYDGGDNSYLPAMSQGIVEKHDKIENLRRKFAENKKKLKQKTKQTNSNSYMDYIDEYGFPFDGWED